MCVISIHDGCISVNVLSVMWYRSYHSQLNSSFVHQSIN